MTIAVLQGTVLIHTPGIREPHPGQPALANDKKLRGRKEHAEKERETGGAWAEWPRGVPRYKAACLSSRVQGEPWGTQPTGNDGRLNLKGEIRWGLRTEP